MPSLFGRLTRYPPRFTFNPTENQHTEALAAVLETDMGLSRALAADWLDIAPEELGSAPRVRTQVPARGLDRVDLELRFEPAGCPQRIVWVEVKVVRRSAVTTSSGATGTHCSTSRHAPMRSCFCSGRERSRHRTRCFLGSGTARLRRRSCSRTGLVPPCVSPRGPPSRSRGVWCQSWSPIWPKEVLS
jgi:hypothetical protein